METNKYKECIHKYLTKCTSNAQPPGFADFLRGTIVLYYLSKEYGYNLYIDGEHPLYKYLKPNKNIINSNNSITEEYLPPISYDNIYKRLKEKFKSGGSLKVMTNSFYNFEKGILSNYGEITEECGEYIKDILTPTEEVENKLKHVIEAEYKIKENESYKVIHIRLGDKYIHNNDYNEELYKIYYKKINKIVKENKEDKYVLITDSRELGRKIKEGIPEIKYWDNNKIHLGDLINVEESGVLDTIIDFFIISKSKEIISNGSGFSIINSVINKIKYTIL
jgi:rRNA-processing protein FCF1